MIIRNLSKTDSQSQGGGGGGGTLKFSYIRRLELFLGAQSFEFQYFFGGGGGFQKKYLFLY